MRVVLFVGSNPSNASTCDIAFHWTTKSSKVLTKWCQDIDGCKAHLNVSNKKTEDNRALTKEEMQAGLEGLRSSLAGLQATHVVALGKTAAKALTLLGVTFYEMPHPSGRNRVLNDAQYIDEKVKGLLDFVKQPSQLILAKTN
jgi:hypothetical protein